MVKSWHGGGPLLKIRLDQNFSLKKYYLFEWSKVQTALVAWISRHGWKGQNFLWRWTCEGATFTNCETKSEISAIWSPWSPFQEIFGYSISILTDIPWTKLTINHFPAMSEKSKWYAQAKEISKPVQRFNYWVSSLLNYHEHQMLCKKMLHSNIAVT